MLTRRAVLAAVLGAPVVGELTACSDAGPGRSGVDATASTSAGMTIVRTPGGAQLRFLAGVSAPVRSGLPGAVDTAMTRVRQVWGAVFAEQQPPRDVFASVVTVMVPATQAEFRALGGGQGAEVAATTRADAVVVLGPDLATEVTADGRVQVIAHELTHVALHSQSSPSARWLVEGPPEWTGYRGSGLTTAQIAPQVAAAVHQGRYAEGPPPDDAFTAQDLQAAYQSAYTWIAFLIERFGERPVLQFVIDQTPHPAARLAVAFHAHFGTSVGGLAPAYRTFQRTTFGGPAGSA